MNDIPQSELSEFLRGFTDALDIPESYYEKAVKRYESIGEWLDRPECLFREDSDVYTQGSFRLGTVVKPITENDEYDLDLVAEFDAHKLNWTQHQLKTKLGNELELYAKAYQIQESLTDKPRCWRLNYADKVKFHIDIVPAVPDDFAFKRNLVAKGIPQAIADLSIAITCKEDKNYDKLSTDWPKGNQRGYAEWFKDRMRVRFSARQREIMLKEARASIEEVPDYKVKTPLQRAVQFLKRHRDYWFKNDEKNSPASIIINTLAAWSYNNESDLYESLVHIVRGMPDYITKRGDETWIENPVNPDENFANRWKGHPEREIAFTSWIEQVQRDVHLLTQLDSFEEIRGHFQKRAGTLPVNAGIDRMNKQASASRTLALRYDPLPNFFEVPHRSNPKWPFSPHQYHVAIEATLERDGFRPALLDSNHAPLPKRCTLRFAARTSAPNPFRVYWQVVNTGKSATLAADERGKFYDGETYQTGKVWTERTKYTGSHWVQCFVVKNNECVGQSKKFVVNIQ